MWSEWQEPSKADRLIVDPSFDASGRDDARRRLATIGLRLEDIGRVVVTHPHGDHRVREGETGLSADWRVFAGEDGGDLSGVGLVPCPGHHERHVAVRFASSDGDTWIAGNAILGEDWLRAWRYYRPNGYHREQIVQTWRTVAAALSRADLVIPGHGPPIPVTRGLLVDLVEGFGCAEYHEDCPDVRGLLEGRLGRMDPNRWPPDHGAPTGR